METWLKFCIKNPVPAAKVGNGIVSSRVLGDIEGETKHSMEGTVAGALGRLKTPYDPNNKYTWASWHFSIPKEGLARQHYPLEAITWHAGLPGDRRLDTSLLGNLTLIGEEHEDYPDNKLNANQIKQTTAISRAVRE